MEGFYVCITITDEEVWQRGLSLSMTLVMCREETGTCRGLK